MRLVLSFKLSERQNLPHADPCTIRANMFDKPQKNVQNEVNVLHSDSKRV